MLVPFGQNLYVADGPICIVLRNSVPNPHGGRSTLERSSLGLVPDCLDERVGCGSRGPRTRRPHRVAEQTPSPFLPEWKERWPNARLYAPPGLARKKKPLQFDAELVDRPNDAWLTDIDQAVFRGSFALVEVVFFHRASRTAILGDLIQRFPESSATGFKGLMMRLGHIVGPHGSTPGDWRLSFLFREPARAARRRVLDWKPERLLIAHGDCATTGASAIIAAALSWI